MDERVSKLMAQRGLCSRREAEEYMLQGLVSVNGILVTMLGSKAPIDSKILLDRTLLEAVTVALHKPLGFVSNLPEKNYREAKELLTEENRFGKGPSIDINSLHVVGRLDINSKGLLLFTSDGRVAKKIIGPESKVEKEYIVRFADAVPENAMDKLRFGLRLDGRALKRAIVKKHDDQTLIIILSEGKKRQIRRMSELVGLEITSLKRVRIGDIDLGNLPLGKWMIVKPSILI